MQSSAAFLSITGSCFLALVFVRALLHKASGYEEFAANVRNYRVVPDSLAGAVAPLLMALEALVVGGLVLPQTRAMAAMLAVLLLAAYALAIAVNLARGRTSIDCGCGGGGQGISPLHLLRNALVALFALPAIAWPAATGVGASVFAATAGCVLVLWLTFLVFDQLLGNFTHAGATTFSKL